MTDEEQALRGERAVDPALVERVNGHRPDKTHRFTDWLRLKLWQWWP